MSSSVNMYSKKGLLFAVTLSLFMHVALFAVIYLSKHVISGSVATKEVVVSVELVSDSWGAKAGVESGKDKLVDKVKLGGQEKEPLVKKQVLVKGTSESEPDEEILAKQDQKQVKQEPDVKKNKENVDKDINKKEKQEEVKEVIPDRNWDDAGQKTQDNKLIEEEKKVAAKDDVQEEVVEKKVDDKKKIDEPAEVKKEIVKKKKPEEEEKKQEVKKIEPDEDDQYIDENFDKIFETKSDNKELYDFVDGEYQFHGNSVRGNDMNFGGISTPESAGLTIAEQNLIRNQIARCWKAQKYDVPDQNIRVQLHVSLSKDGSVLGVEFTDSAIYTTLGESEYRTVADSAKRAVIACTPIVGLPPYKYSAWKLIELNFVIDNGSMQIN